MRDIEINGIKWTVRFMPAPKDDNRMGYMNPTEYSITIYNDYPSESFRHTLIHELVHAFVYSQGKGYNAWRNMNQEELCEFVSCNADPILKLASEILRDRHSYY